MQQLRRPKGRLFYYHYVTEVSFGLFVGDAGFAEEAPATIFEDGGAG